MLAVAGGKGGCGKTTTTIGLALAAARAGRSVLAVDADVDVPDLHHVAGVDRDPRGGPPEAPVAVPGHPDVGVLPAPTGARPGETSERLTDRSDEADLVLVDCPAGGGPDVAHPLRVADRTLVVTTAERAALRDAAKTAAMSRAVGTPVVGGLVTRARRPPAGVERLLGAEPLGAVPPADRPLDDPVVSRSFTRVFGRLPDV